jgi:hypothetical protein
VQGSRHRPRLIRELDEVATPRADALATLARADLVTLGASSRTEKSDVASRAGAARVLPE